ncbi:MULTISPECIES: hypothetical protein [Lentzea]|uniref:Uncharacterized protein n=1 Tax=Lentzea flaviverrucosa TaxID=200379 RepID=A0A1H9LX97_9PSEU|nr:hypothetical protein [Lentzea flaviverrucosa]RDI31161.1 hypothetical protein DFR72_104498 [Lentzea flaviverrucosa]SER15837.1 hypothetical protein SAMN05216195_104128 [Lentzea flaviverrucosa]
MGRRVALAAGVGALLGLAWWGMFELLASGAVCSKDDWGCLQAFVIAAPVFAVLGAVVGGFALRALSVSRAWLVAVPATLMAVVAMVLLLGMTFLAFAVFAALYALIAVLTGARREGAVEGS